MYFAYGPYQHASGEVDVMSVQKIPWRSEIDVTIGYTQQLVIRGFLQASNSTSLTSAMVALELAYSRDGYNAGLYEEDGTPTHHVMLSAAAQGGVRVAAFNFVKQSPAYYTTFVTYEITLEAKFLTAGRNQIVAWTETLSFTGDGGPRFVLQQPLIGPPLKWQVATQTPYMGAQFGTAIMLLDYPTPPPSLFPQAEHRDRRRLERIHPQIINGALQNYGVSWNYEFESVAPLFGSPTIVRL